MSWSWSRALWGVIAFMVTASAAAPPELVRVRHTEGIVHGFLVLRDQGGKAIARGDVTQNAQASRVTSRLTFHFFDGSLYDETAVFSQRSSFRLIRDRLRQNGPSFPTAVDMSIDVAAQRVTVAYSDDGKNKTANKRMELPADLANGLIPVLLKNVDRDAPPRALPMVVATPEPQLITLEITAAEPEAFSKDDQHQRVTEYTLTPHIGGVKGLLARSSASNPLTRTSGSWRGPRRRFWQPSSSSSRRGRCGESNSASRRGGACNDDEQRRKRPQRSKDRTDLRTAKI